MNLKNWWWSVRQRNAQPSPRAPRSRWGGFRPAFERLEDRLVPAVHNVTTGIDYPTIQAAVTAANPGNTLLADPGTYVEQVTINKPLVLQGARHGVDARDPSRTGTAVDESIVTGVGNNGNTPFSVTANNVTLDGFVVEGATSANNLGFGIVLGAGTSGAQVVNNIVRLNIAGLSL